MLGAGCCVVLLCTSVSAVVSEVGAPAQTGALLSEGGVRRAEGVGSVVSVQWRQRHSS